MNESFSPSRPPQDYSVDCDSAIHHRYVVYAWVFIVIYPIGTPLCLGYLLWRSRKRLNPPHAKSEADALSIRAGDQSIAALHQLFYPYRPTYFYFEVVDIYRRILMTGSLILIRGKPQRAVVGLGLSLLFVALYQTACPYVTTPLQALSISGVWMLVLVYGGGMLLVSRPCSFSDIGLGVILLIAMLIFGVMRGIIPPDLRDEMAIFVLITAIGLSEWVPFARTVRATTLVEKEKEYVQAARLIGLRRTQIMWRHILPNVIGPVLVIATITLALAIIAEATLSFLGVGAPPTEPSLGTLIRIGQDFLFSGEWWILTFPAVTLLALALSVNLLGDWLKDTLNPRLK